MLKRGVVWTIVGVATLSLVLGLAVWDYHHYLGSPIAVDDQLQKRNEKLVIPEGATLSQVLEWLEESRVITSPTYFRVHLLVSEKAGKIKAGVYHFSFDMTPEAVADSLVEGPRNPYIRLTIREGYNVWQVAQAIEEAGIASADEALALCQNEEFARSLGVPIPKGAPIYAWLEGYLFPETYFVAPGQSLERVLGRMVKQTFLELDASKKRNVRQFIEVHREFAFNDRELLTLASLAERETALPHEKKLVVSVFLNRIREGMKLQTDPTLTYTAEKKGGKSVPEDKDNTDNPYNTYAFEGLPPGPICNPGRDAIDGAVAPVRTDFLYFVAKRDGTRGHEFNATYEAHDKAVGKYLRGEKP